MRTACDRRRRGVVVAAAMAALWGAACHGDSGTPVRTVRVAVQGNPQRSSTAACVFLLRATVTGGGTQLTCLGDVRGFPGPGSVMQSTAMMTFRLPDGTLRARVRITQRFRADGVHARQATTGHVTGGTGSFAGDVGTIAGSGTVADRAEAIGPVDLTYTIRLRTTATPAR